MRIVDLKYQKFNFNFSKPFRNSTQQFLSKDVIILIMRTKNGKTHFGEVSPLVGFCEENILECEDQIKSLITKIDSTEELQHILSENDLFPTVRFGIEQLLLDHSIAQDEIEIKEKVIEISGLIGVQGAEDILRQVNELVEKGFDTIKIKLGKLNFEDELKILSEIIIQNPKLKIRVDVNGKWNYEAAKNNLSHLIKLNIQYVEQPTKLLEDINKLSKDYADIIAVDEGTESYSQVMDLINENSVKYLVIKPSQQFGIFTTKKIIEAAKNNNVEVIISSAFETAIGKKGLFYLSSLSNNLAQGLGTETLGSEKVISKINYDQPNLMVNKSFFEEEIVLKF